MISVESNRRFLRGPRAGTLWAMRAAMLALLISLFPATAAADVQGVVALEAGVSFAEPSLVAGVEAGVRIDGQWTLLIEVDWNPWFAIAAPDPVEPGALNVGIGLEHIFADGLLRVAAFFGTCTLLFETALDQAGETGVFVDVVPLSLRLPVVDDLLTLRFDPISAHLLAPVMSGLPLVRYEFRHAVSLELTP